MPIADKNRIYDGWMSLEGGVDAGRHPSMIDPNQCVSSINMTFRGGDSVARPGFRKLSESFANFALLAFEQGNGVLERLVAVHVEYVPDPVVITNFFVSDVPHGLEPGNRIRFYTTGTMPDPLIEDHDYFVIASGITGTKFKVSTTHGGPEVDLSTVGVGELRVSPPRLLTDTDSETIYRTGIMQGALVYNSHGNEDCIVAMVGGRMFKIFPDKDSARASEVIPQDTESPYFLDTPIPGEGFPRQLLPYRNRKDLPIAYMLQADKWLLVQDGNSKCIIFDGVTARRSKNVADVDHTEVPTGTIMAYGMGRVVVIVNDRDVAFGDLFGSHDTEDPADSLILFTERNFLAEGFDAALPVQNGVATGMSFFPQLDTSTGNGQLLVFSERGASSFFMSLPREEWKTSQFQIFALLTTGLRGHRSIGVVNEDLWFRSDDGTRSYRQARSEAGGWAHIPLSTNVGQFMDVDPKELLRFCSASYFDNRYLVTTSPYWNHGRPLHDGILVVDFNILSSFGERFKPAWEGYWTIPNSKVTQVLEGTFNGVPRMFAFGVDEDGNNQLYELSTADKDDWDGQGIQWEMISRQFDFTKLTQQSNPFTESSLYDGDLWLREIAQSQAIDPNHVIEVFYRPDEEPDWIPWRTFDSRTLALIGRAGSVDHAGLPTARAGFRPRLSFGKPGNVYDKTTRRNTRRAFQYQLKFKGSGHIVLDRFRLHAQKQVERATAKNVTP